MFAARSLASWSVVALSVAHAGLAQTGDSPKVSTKAQAYRARILGVFDERTGDPVEGVEVIDLLTGTSALTTVSGTVALVFLPDGGSIVRIRKIGFAVQSLRVSISPADTSPVTVVLTPLATELATVHVTDSARAHLSPALRGFEERRTSGMGGYFITADELRKADGRPLANLLSTKVAGITVDRQGRRTFLLSMRAGFKAKCYPDIYLDGVPFTGRPAPDLSELEVDRFAGVEFYAGGATLPAEFNRTASGCGALLLWTRDR